MSVNFDRRFRGKKTFEDAVELKEGADVVGNIVHVGNTTQTGNQTVSGTVAAGFLTGNGSGRFHYYADLRNDYFDHMTSEAKVPSKLGKKTWQLRAGRRCEAWDCEVYALHAARAKRVHLFKPEDWQKIKAQMSQEDLFAAAADAPIATGTNNPVKPERTTERRPSRR